MIRFDVHGVPAPKGSMKALHHPGMKFAVVVSDNRRTKPWQKLIAKAAAAAKCPKLEGPLVVLVEFHMPRPKGHYGKRGLRPSAPIAHVVKPDVDKLERALLDGLKGVAFVDDSQVISVLGWKRYVGFDEVPGACVAIAERDTVQPIFSLILEQLSDRAARPRVSMSLFESALQETGETLRAEPSALATIRESFLSGEAAERGRRDG